MHNCVIARLHDYMIAWLPRYLFVDGSMSISGSMNDGTIIIKCEKLSLINSLSLFE